MRKTSPARMSTFSTKAKKLSITPEYVRGTPRGIPLVPAVMRVSRPALDGGRSKVPRPWASARAINSGRLISEQPGSIPSTSGANSSS